MAENENETPLDSEVEVTRGESLPEADSQEQPSQPEQSPAPVQKKKPSFINWYTRHKKISIPLTILLLLIVLLAVPITRYAMLSPFVKKSVTVTVVDSGKNVPVSQASVTIAGENAETDQKGKATISVPVGVHTVKVTKKYYKTSTSSMEVGLFNTVTKRIKFDATGRLTTIKVLNKISGQTVSNVRITAGSDNEALTDTSGTATLVIPASQKTAPVTVSGDKYNQLETSLTPDVTNTITIVPEGKLYFLSKQSGKLDVVSTDLDGNNRKTVLKGSGFEDDGDTSLLASRDWRYLALKAKRSSSKTASLWLIDTKTGDTKEVDKGDIEVNMIGWSGHNFWYHIGRNNLEYWQSKSYALKVYKADSSSLAIVDETSGTGTNYENAYTLSMEDYYILDDMVTYVKEWSWPTDSPNLNGKNHSIVAVNGDGSAKRTLKSIKAGPVYRTEARLYKPQEVYYALYDDEDEVTQFLELENGVVGSAETTESKFNRPYPTFIVSPSGKKTFWRESRDGKNALFVGDINGNNEKLIAAASEFTPYGWLSDDYILLQKDDSELYASTLDRIKSGGEPVKISNYHKPDYAYGGYGYGYGGQ